LSGKNEICYFGASAKILLATPGKSTPWEEILPTPTTEYVPEEAARCAGSDCGPEREDSSDSGMGSRKNVFQGGGALEDFSKIFLGGKKW